MALFLSKPAVLSTRIHLVNTPAGVADLLGELQNAPVVAVDCEGSDLGRHGRLCTLTVAIHGRNEAWVVDVVEMGRLAFSTPGLQGDGSTLKAWLESTSAVKLLYDARADCDALYHQYGVQLGRCLDLQVAEVAYRRHYRHVPVRFVMGLGKALKEYAAASGAADSLVKTAVQAEFTNPEFWVQRPLTDTQLAYCAEDVVPLFQLYDKFWGSLKGMRTVMERVWSASEARVLEALRPEAPVIGPHRAEAPNV